MVAGGWGGGRGGLAEVDRFRVVVIRFKGAGLVHGWLYCCFTSTIKIKGHVGTVS